ncbi:hypothetical protein I4U23_016355 [Adineta vaga]|nr:hypothetical protein I4U23_016355 [Adineta vaga]
MPVRLNFGQCPKDISRIEGVWTFTIYLISIVFSCFYMTILTVVLASLELEEKGSQLSSYDRGVCIFFLVVTSCVIFFVIYGIISKKSMSR